MYIFCIDKNKNPADPIHPKTVNMFLEQGKAAWFRQFPPVLILNQESEPLQKYILKIDPGSKTTGLAIVTNDIVVWAALLQHHRKLIVDNLKSRSAIRRNRRSRKTPYRKARFNNRSRKEGWLPPSAESCLSNIITWVAKILKFCPISEIWVENNKFDPQKAINPNISGKEYQSGPLNGYKNVRDLLLETQDKCYKCGEDVKKLKKLGIPLERDHCISRKHGGSDSSRNAMLICRECNLEKSKASEEVTKCKSLTGMSAMNQIRYILPRRLEDFYPVVRSFDSYMTSRNREEFVCKKEIKDENKDKFHWIDASCIGPMEKIKSAVNSVLEIKSRGHGTRQMCQTDKFGFPKQHRKPKGHDIRTGDMVKVVDPKNNNYGRIFPVIGARADGCIKLTDKVSITHKKLTVLHHTDGYLYKWQKPLFARGFPGNSDKVEV